MHGFGGLYNQQKVRAQRVQEATRTTSYRRDEDIQTSTQHLGSTEPTLGDIATEYRNRAGHLLDDGVEEAAGELLLDALLEPEVRSDVCHIRLISRTSTARKNTDDTPIPADDDRTRVSRARELVVLEGGRVVAEDDVLLGNLVDAVVGVVASN